SAPGGFRGSGFCACRGSLHREWRPELSGSVSAVLFLNQAVKLGWVRGSEKMLAEGLILEQPRNSGQSLEMQTRGIFRRDQHKKKMGRPAVQRVEVDAGGM